MEKQLYLIWKARYYILALIIVITSIAIGLEYFEYGMQQMESNPLNPQIQTEPNPFEVAVRAILVGFLFGMLIGCVLAAIMGLIHLAKTLTRGAF